MDASQRLLLVEEISFLPASVERAWLHSQFIGDQARLVAKSKGYPDWKAVQIERSFQLIFNQFALEGKTYLDAKFRIECLVSQIIIK